MNINYLKGPGTEPGTWIVPLRFECPLWGHSLKCGQECVGLGREGTGPCKSRTPSPGGACTSCDTGSPQALTRALTQSSWLQGAHLSLRMAPQCPAAWHRAGVYCQSALPCSHKSVVSWKEICALEAKEQGPRYSSAIDTLCDLDSSLHLSGPWGVSSKS